MSLNFPPGSLVFAPMEGITDGPFRLAIHEAFGGWDQYFTDFLRVPTHGFYTKRKIIEHFGEKIYTSPVLNPLNAMQILTTARAQTERLVKEIAELNINHLNLNLGCPSKTVNGHCGGAYLLQEPETIAQICKLIRQNFSKSFTVKIRLGFNDTENFDELIRILSDSGVDGIIIHGRTAKQKYDGLSNWEMISRAVNLTKTPIIGNGDLLNVKDIENAFKNSGCYGLMLGRGALKTPWLAAQYKNKWSTDQTVKNILEYYDRIEWCYRIYGDNDEIVLKRMKGLTRYIFSHEEINLSPLLRMQTLEQFKPMLPEMVNSVFQ